MDLVDIREKYMTFPSLPYIENQPAPPTGTPLPGGAGVAAAPLT
jgi:hypothetical protein